MLKIFEFIGGVMFLVALIEFLPSPRRALEETQRVLVSPSPKIVGGHLVLPAREEQPRSGAEQGPRRNQN